ncbi:hypothetical protein NXX24_21190 (plasmid) [Bacteroides fragilis]|nr:hypothetical protein [Bacteroides fragilis]
MKQSFSKHPVPGDSAPDRIDACHDRYGANLTNDALNLSGMWRFQLDPMGFGKTPGSELYLDKLSETIMLPGSTDQRGKGIKKYGTLRRPFKP